jgi:hypothetical protein
LKSTRLGSLHYHSEPACYLILQGMGHIGQYVDMYFYVYLPLSFSFVTMGNQCLAWKAKQAMCHHQRSWSREGSSWVTPHVPGWDKNNALSGSKSQS